MKRMLSGKSAYQRDLADSRAKLRVTERLRYRACDACGTENSLWVPPEAPEPDEFGRPMTHAWKCTGCGALVCMTLEARPPGAQVHALGEWAPFVHEHFGDRPVVVESRSHFKRLLKEHGYRTDHE